MTEQLMEILISALTGGTLVQLLNWWRERRLQKARSGVDVDSAYERLRHESAADSTSLQREEPAGAPIRASPTGWQWLQIWIGRIALLWAAIQTGLKLYSNSKRKTI